MTKRGLKRGPRTKGGAQAHPDPTTCPSSSFISKKQSFSSSQNRNKSWAPLSSFPCNIILKKKGKHVRKTKRKELHVNNTPSAWDEHEQEMETAFVL